MRGSILGLCAAAALAAPVSISPLASSAAAQTPAPVPQVVVDGRGWGHGVGMSQDGALAMGVAGAGTEDILQAFYPGTTLGRRSGTVNVTIFDAPQPQVTVSLPEGGEISDGGGSPGFPIAVDPGGSVRISAGGGRYRATPLAGATPSGRDEPPAASPGEPPGSTADTPPSSPTTPTTLFLGLIPVGPPATLAPSAPAPQPAVNPASPVRERAEPTSDRALSILPAGGSSVVLPEVGRRYSGTLETSTDGSRVQLVNTVNVEKYLRGMGEVRDPGWPPASLRAQAIAARTYALRAPAAGATLCSTDRCQVYLGETVEYGAMNAAVDDTEGQVVLYKGSLALSVYSASGGGISATPEEGFGSPDREYPYLRSAAYPTQDPMPWNLTTPLSDLGRRFGYRGDTSDVRVSRAGPSGRALEITFDGSAGPMAIDGRTFASTLQLRSNLFGIRVEKAPIDPMAGSSSSGGVTVAGFNGTRASALVAAGEPPGLGRAPWIALAILLVVVLLSGVARLGSRPELPVRLPEFQHVSPHREAPAVKRAASGQRKAKPAGRTNP